MKSWAPLACVACIVLCPCLAWADEPSAESVGLAREAYTEGIRLVKEARWGDALTAFERSAALKPHALTLYNVAISERALGRLTRARDRLLEALARNDASGGTELAASYVDETRGLLREIDALLVPVTLTIDPPDAALTIDGRSLLRDRAGLEAVQQDTFIAGLASPDVVGPQLPGRIKVLVDPGARVFVLTKKGFAPATHRQTFKPGIPSDVPLSLTALDATISIRAERPDAVVRLSGLDIGTAPVVVRRPPGSYSLDVRSPGYVTYATNVNVGAGDTTELYAKMPKEPVAIVKQWWFWTGIAAVVAGSAVTVYAVTRPPAPYNGGSTGWVAEVK